VKADGVSISAQIATQMATTENSTPNNGRMPRPHPCSMLAISGAMKLEMEHHHRDARTRTYQEQKCKL
jgi:hypothetical protein